MFNRIKNLRHCWHEETCCFCGLKRRFELVIGSKKNHGTHIPVIYKTRWVRKYSDPERKYKCNRK